MTEPLMDADEVLDYIREQAQHGAEQAKAFLDATLAMVLVPPVALSSLHCAQLEGAAHIHIQYLALLRSTVALAEYEVPHADHDDEEF